MPRPEVGAVLQRCDECGGSKYGGAPSCGTCARLVDEIVEDAWVAFLQRADPRHDAETAVAQMVADEPDRHDWRVVDAAPDRPACSGCRNPLSRVKAAAAHDTRGVLARAVEGLLRERTG